MLLAGKVKEGLRLFVAPLRYWRFWPNGLVVRELPPGSARVLDVSSPKLLSIFLAATRDCSLHATDLDDPKLMTRWEKLARLSGRDNYRAEFQDARRLAYPDESFDLVYSISVIEHIPGQGDTDALREFARVLKPGGSVVIEVPYRREAKEFWFDYDSKGFALPAPQFYERHYDRHQLVERLRVDELELVGQCLQSEWIPLDPWIAPQHRLPQALRWLIMPFEPLLAMCNLSLEPDDRHANPLAAMLVFRKPLSNGNKAGL